MAYVDREALYAELQPLVRRLIRRYGTSSDLRQDLTNEIYYRFCTLLDAYDPLIGVPLRAYLVRVLPGAVYSYMRAQWRHHRREVAILPELGDDFGGSTGDLTREWDRALWMREAVEALPAAIATLPHRQKVVVIARYYEGRGFDEIAADLGIQPATVRSLLRHGVEHLRRRLRAAAGSGPFSASDSPERESSLSPR